MTRTSFDGARAMIARVRSIEAVLQDENFLANPEWLLLPLAKQEVVLQRLEALREYDRLTDPTSVDALRAAKSAGVAIARFYQLVTHWRGHDRSPFSLVPHQSLGAERKTRLGAQETATAIIKAIETLLRREPLASTGAVISHVRRTWRGPGELPSDTALRAFHDRVIRSNAPRPGSLTLSTPGQPPEDDVIAERLGETLVIDHVSIKGLVAQEDGLQPTVTLAIDLWSGCPLGAAAVAGSPGPHGLVMALRDAAGRIAAGGGGDGGIDPSGQSKKPRLVVATTFARRWAGLVDELLADGYEVVERRDAFLQQGGPARRILGMRIGWLPLEHRADRRFAFDPRTTAVQPLHVVGKMLGDAIQDMIDQRVSAAAWKTAIPFDATSLAEPADAMAVESLEGSQGEPRRRGRPPLEGRSDVEAALNELASSPAPDGARLLRVREGEDRVWRLAVAVDDESRRDAAFFRLAQGAMVVSARHGVPIVVDVEVEGGDDGR